MNEFDKLSIDVIKIGTIERASIMITEVFNSSLNVYKLNKIYI